MEITLYVNDAEVGPISLEEVQAMLANGELTMEDFAFFEGCADWVPVSEIPGINDAPVEEEAVEEEEAPAEEAAPAPEAQEATIYVWPEGAEDWAGPYTLSQVQEQLANEEIAAESFAAFDGSAEGATVADIPEVYDAPAAAEEPAEEEAIEEDAAPAPAKKGFGAKKKGGFAKKGGGGLKKAGGGGLKKAGGGMKKAGGGAVKKGGAAKTAGKGKAKGAAKKAAAKPDVVENGGDNVEENKAKGKGLRITSGVLMILGLLGNMFVGSCSTFLGSIGELGAEAADEVGTAVVNEVSEQNGTNNDTSVEDTKKKINDSTDEIAAKSSHAKFHGYALLAAGFFALFGSIFSFVGRMGIVLLISGIFVTLIGIWGLVATFMVGMFFIYTGLWNLATGILAILASRTCK